MAAKPEDIMGDGSILKTIIKAGTGEEKPAWGNKVKVHYVGTLTSNGEKFDSSRDRNSPFDFQVGSGVITGWSEAVPTMLLGEVAKFTISSEKAYGPGGSPPKIPPNASLDFEIELLSFTDREDVLSDGTLMKKQLGKPDEDSWVTPNANCDLELKLTIAGGDQHDVSWPSGSGCPHGLPPRLREGLFEMRKGETCSFLLPKDAPGVDYEVTLVSWVENEECVSGDDGAVVKRIERDKTIGKDDWKCPHDLDTVHIRGKVWVDGDEAKCVDYGEIPPNTDGSQDAAVYVVDEDLTTSTGAAVCPGVDAVVKKLRVGEISTAIIRKDYGFSDGPLAGQALRCRLELVKIDPQQPNWEIKTTDLKIEAVNAKRCLGNAWVARSDIPRAIRRYGAAIEIGDSDYDITDEDEKRRLREAVAACKLNRAMCHLKLKHYADCEKDCSDVLDIDPTSVKALFRQGKCYLALDKWDAAKESFRKVLELDDGNMEARRGLQSVRVKMQAQKEKEKKLYAGKKLFDGKDRPVRKAAPPTSCCDAPGEGSCCPPPPPEAAAPPAAEQ